MNERLMPHEAVGEFMPALDGDALMLIDREWMICRFRGEKGNPSRRLALHRKFQIHSVRIKRQS